MNVLLYLVLLFENLHGCGEQVYGFEYSGPTLEYSIFMTEFTYFFLFLYRVPDNGVDIFGPYKEHILIVQCKAYTSLNVGKDDIRAFEGSLLR